MSEVPERLYVTPSTVEYWRKNHPDHWERYEFASKFVFHESNVIDIACGTGYGTSLLSLAGATNVFGLDKDESAIESAIAHYGNEATFICQNAEDWNEISNNSIDLIVSFETIEHLTQPELYLDECARVLKPKGLIILSTPLNERSDRFKPSNPHHIREYNWTEFGNIVNNHFKIKSRYSQISSRETIANRVKQSKLSGIIRLMPNKVKSILFRVMNILGMNKGSILPGHTKFASVQIVLGCCKD